MISRNQVNYNLLEKNISQQISIDFQSQLLKNNEAIFANRTQIGKEKSSVVQAFAILARRTFQHLTKEEKINVLSLTLEI